ncbi:cytochrome P450 724B1-like [Elaeis guineensis]|uniref:cytochrome P450 724B1-like n=1 Tax=Elaeis guineensis var. tenera TaxID=51953 RepID=UPI003C6D07A2
MSLLLHPFTLSLVISLFLYLFFHHILRRHTRASKLPPGSFGWCPFLGDTLSFITPHFSFSRGKFLDENIKRYGKIFRSHLFGHPTIVSCDAEFNSFILQNEDRLFQSSYPKNIPGVLGNLTLLFVTGSEHKRLRGLALDLFAGMRTKNASFISDIEDNVLQVMDSWKTKKTLVFCEETRKFTFRVIVKQILSLRPEDPETPEILNNFTAFMRGLVSVPINLPGTPYAKAIQAKWRIREIVRNIWHRRESGEQQVKGRMDFLDVLIDGNRIPEEEVLSLVLDLLLGGYETTAMLIAIIVRFLSVNPKMLGDLKEEHLMVRRSKGENEPMEWDDYNKMEFTRCLINEALRLGNVVKFVHRKAVKPIQFKERGRKQRKEVNAIWRRHKVVPWVRDRSFRDQSLSSPSCPQVHMDSVDGR